MDFQTFLFCPWSSFNNQSSHVLNQKKKPTTISDRANYESQRSKPSLASDQNICGGWQTRVLIF